MPGVKYTYLLRLPRMVPDRFPMDRLADYLHAFADLLGHENVPAFKGIKKASVGLMAWIPEEKSEAARIRLVEAVTVPDSKSAKHHRKIEQLLGDDGIDGASLFDAAGSVVCSFVGHQRLESEVHRIYQRSTVDGTVTGLIGADATMHLHLRDYLDRDFRLLVRDETLARELLGCFRNGLVRLTVHGTWVRTDSGWVPEASKCTVDNYCRLDETPPGDVFREMAAVEENGWAKMENPHGFWAALRGLS